MQTKGNILIIILHSDYIETEDLVAATTTKTQPDFTPTK